MKDCGQCNSFKNGAAAYAKLYETVRKKFVAEVAKPSVKDAKQYSPGKDYYKEMETHQKNVSEIEQKFATKQCPHRMPDVKCPNQEEVDGIWRGMTCVV